jgi:hypothetical protein
MVHTQLSLISLLVTIAKIPHSFAQCLFASQNNRHKDHPTWLSLHICSSHSNNSFLLVITSHDVIIVVVNSISSYFLDELGTKLVAIKVY